MREAGFASLILVYMQLCDYCSTEAKYKVWKNYYCTEHYAEYQAEIAAQAADFEGESDYNG